MHGMLTFVPDLRTRRNDLTSPRKAGALIPIGSEQSTEKVTKSVNNREIPLKFFQPPGTGFPSILTEERRGEKRSWPTTRSYQDFFASLENFGFFEATGSVTRISEERGLRNCFYRINGVSGYATETRYTERFAVGNGLVVSLTFLQTRETAAF